VSTAASLSIDTFDVDNTKRISRDNTTLIEMEAKLLLSVCLVHEVLIDCVAAINDAVGLIFNSSLFFLGDTLEVSNIKMSTLSSFLGTILPDMGSQNFSA
jgi:hypothetical protein